MVVVEQQFWEYESHVRDTSIENCGHKILRGVSVQLLIHCKLDGIMPDNLFLYRMELFLVECLS